MNRIIGCALILSLCAITSRVHAEDEETFPLHVVADSDAIDIEVIDASMPGLVARCYGSCTMQLPRGRYTVQMNGRNVPSAKLAIHFQDATEVEARAGNNALRWVGGVVGVLASIYSGATLTALAITDECHAPGDWLCRDFSNKQGRNAVVVSGLIAIGGFTVLALGKSRLTEKTEPTPEAAVAFGFLPAKDGGSFGIAGAF